MPTTPLVGEIAVSAKWSHLKNVVKKNPTLLVTSKVCLANDARTAVRILTGMHGLQIQLCLLFCVEFDSQSGNPCEVNPAIEFSAQNIPIKIGI